MDRNDLFQQAFGRAESRDEPTRGTALDVDTRTGYFEAAFGQAPQKELPNPNIRSWRLNAAKSSRLSFAELMEMDRLQKANTHYSELPVWVIEGGYVAPTQAEKLRQSQLEKETGYNTVERAQIFSAFQADLGALAAMTEKESLRGSIFLDEYLEAAFKRFGEAEVMNALKEDYPQAAEHLVAHVEVKRAEAKAAEAALRAESAEADVAAELQAAKEAIEMMNANNKEGEAVE